MLAKKVKKMPPSKVVIQRIEGNRMRQNTFHKRKLGLIKKAIELTVLCDCDCAIVLRSGPTVTCKEGRLMAYCNKNINEMLEECRPTLASLNHFTNADYARFSKDKDAISLVAHSTSVARDSAGHPSAAWSPLPALALDDDEDESFFDAEKAQLKARIQALEDENNKLKQKDIPIAPKSMEHAGASLMGMKTRSTRMQVVKQEDLASYQQPHQARQHSHNEQPSVEQMPVEHYSSGKRTLDPPPVVDNTPTPEALVNITVTPRTTGFAALPVAKRQRISPSEGQGQESSMMPPPPKTADGIFGHMRRLQQEYTAMPPWMTESATPANRDLPMVSPCYKELPSPSASFLAQAHPSPSPGAFTPVGCGQKLHPNVTTFDPSSLGGTAATVFENDKLSREDSWSLENLLVNTNMLGGVVHPFYSRPPLSPSGLFTPMSHGPVPIENPCTALRV